MTVNTSRYVRSLEDGDLDAVSHFCLCAIVLSPGCVTPYYLLLPWVFRLSAPVFSDSSSLSPRSERPSVSPPDSLSCDWPLILSLRGAFYLRLLRWLISCGPSLIRVKIFALIQTRITYTGVSSCDKPPSEPPVSEGSLSSPRRSSLYSVFWWNLCNITVLLTTKPCRFFPLCHL